MKLIIQKESIIELFGKRIKLIERSDVPDNIIYFISDDNVTTVINLSLDSQVDTPR